MSTWILCSARSGSTYLAKILSELVGEPFPEAFSAGGKYHTKCDFEIEPCNYAKVLHIQFNRLFHPVEPFDPDPSKQAVRHLIRPTADDRMTVERYVQPSYIKLRRDPVNQACSYYIASIANDLSDESFFYIDNPNKQKRLQNINITKDDDRATRMMTVVQSFNSIWDDYINDSDCLTLVYENLDARHPSTIRELADFTSKSVTEVHEAMDVVDMKLYKAATSRPDIESYKQWMREIAKNIP